MLELLIKIIGTAVVDVLIVVAHEAEKGGD